tara:strand:- start:77 stop:352 length:276 start_codon:yes stop_codon:yes gene_type:complete
MKINDKQLKQIIKEELENIMETKFPSNPFSPDRKPALPPEVKKAIENAAELILKTQADKEEALLQFSLMIKADNPTFSKSPGFEEYTKLEK